MPRGQRLDKGMRPSEFNLNLTHLLMNGDRNSVILLKTCKLVFGIPAKLNKEQQYLMKQLYYIQSAKFRSDGGNTDWEARYIALYNGYIEEQNEKRIKK